MTVGMPVGVNYTSPYELKVSGCQDNTFPCTALAVDRHGTDGALASTFPTLTSNDGITWSGSSTYSSPCKASDGNTIANAYQFTETLTITPAGTPQGLYYQSFTGTLSQTTTNTTDHPECNFAEGTTRSIVPQPGRVEVHR